jgi:hypothetical protein
MHLDLDIAERASVAITFEAMSSLTSYYLEHPDSIGFSPPLVLGWDIRRQLGDREGFGIWRELMIVFEPALRKEELLGPGDPRICLTFEQYDAGLRKQWERYGQGEMHWTEMLLVDAMAKARADGWEIPDDMYFTDDLDAEIANPTPVRAATEAILDDLARRSGAKRAAVEAEHDARLRAENDAIQAEIDAEFAIYEKWIAAGEPASDPLATDHAERKRRIQQAQFARDIKSGKIPMPGNTRHSTVASAPAAPLPDLLVSSADFIAAFVPAEYLIDGTVQRRYFYSMTAQTGVGKTSNRNAMDGSRRSWPPDRRQRSPARRGALFCR